MARTLFKQSINPVRNTNSSFTVFMLTLNVNKVCKIRVIRKNFALPKIWKYNIELHDPNMTLTFEWYKDAMVFRVLRRYTSMRPTYITVLVIFLKKPF